MRLQMLALCGALMLGSVAIAEDAVGPAMRQTITNQLDAFENDDLERAFSYAAPGIQTLFGNPQNFGMMVKNGYPMVWRPGAVTFLDLHAKRGGTWQKVAITDAAGHTHVLDYEVVETPEGIRIGAVEVLQAPGVGV